MAINELKIKSKDRELIQKIRNGNESAILQGLTHPGAFYRVNATINAVKYEIKGPALKIYMERLKEDQIIMDGYRVSDFAFAALDILGLEKYYGNDLRVRKMIEAEFWYE